jgi:hypothetical protein
VGEVEGHRLEGGRRGVAMGRGLAVRERNDRETLSVYLYTSPIQGKICALLAGPSFVEAGLIVAHLQKWIYGGGCLKTTASRNRGFLDAVDLRCPSL